MSFLSRVLSIVRLRNFARQRSSERPLRKHVKNVDSASRRRARNVDGARRRRERSEKSDDRRGMIAAVTRPG